MTPKSPYRRRRLAPSMSAHHILGLEKVPRVRLFAELKWYVSWVQNVVRQFGPYLPWVLEY